MPPRPDHAPSLAWAERPFRELLRLSWPIAVSTLSYSIMTLVDTLLVSRLGPSELAGVGLGGTAVFVLLCFSLGLLRGTKTLVSQAVGARRHRDLGAHLGAALSVAGLLGTLTILLGPATAELLRRISASAAAGRHAATYVQIRVLGAPLLLLYTALREVRYGQGDARSPMIATVVANVVNIALAVWFLFGLRLGVAGAAWATVLAHGVEAGTLALAQSGAQAGEAHRGRVRDLRLAHLRALWQVGWPTGVQFSLEIGSFALLAAMIASWSEVQMGAHQIALQVIHVSFLPALAVSEAASVLAGQAVGADRDELVLLVGHRGLVLAGAYNGLCTLLLALCAPWIAARFHAPPELLAATVRLLHVAAVFQIFDGANMMARATLRGSGDVRFPAVVGVLTAWAMTPPLTWLLGGRLGLLALGGWIGLCCEIVLGALILWARLERGGWRAAAERSRALLLLGVHVKADFHGEEDHRGGRLADHAAAREASPGVGGF